MKRAVTRRIFEATGDDEGTRMFPIMANRLPADATTVDAAGSASSWVPARLAVLVGDFHTTLLRSLCASYLTFLESKSDDDETTNAWCLWGWKAPTLSNPDKAHKRAAIARTFFQLRFILLFVQVVSLIFVTLSMFVRDFLFLDLLVLFSIS